MLKIQVIGKPTLVLNERPVGPALGQKLRSIIWYLAIENRKIDREKIAELFWPEKESEKQRANLRQSLTRINKQLDGVIVREEGCIYLKQDASVTVDLFRLTTGSADISTTDQAEWLQSIGLNLLDGCDSFYLGELQGWLRDQRSNCSVRLGRCFAEYAHEMHSCGELQHAIALCRRWLSLDICNESAHRLLMQALADDGQRHAALVQYENCRQILIEELGARPGSDTYETYRQIHESCTPNSAPLDVLQENRTNEIQPSAGPHNTEWFHRGAHLFGRDASIEAVLDLLNDRACRLLSLQGPPGIGKSWLAAGVAKAWKARSDRAVYWYVVPSQKFYPTDFCEQLAAAMGQRLDGNLSAEDALTQLVFDSSALLIIDNIEVDQPVASILEYVLHRTTSVTVLTTTRVRLRIGVGWSYLVKGLATGPVDSNPSLASQFFFRCLRSDNADRSYAEDNANPQDVEVIGTILDGSPLALELAAALTGRMSIKEIRHMLERAGTGSMLAEDAAMQGVLATMDHHWNSLNSDIQSNILKCKQIPGVFSQVQAETVCEITPASFRQMIDAGWIHRENHYLLKLHPIQTGYLDQQLQPQLALRNQILNNLTNWWQDRLGQSANIDQRMLIEQMPELMAWLRERTDTHKLEALVTRVASSLNTAGAWRQASFELSRTASIEGIDRLTAGLWLLEAGHLHNMAADIDNAWRLYEEGMKELSLSERQSPFQYIKLWFSVATGKRRIFSASHDKDSYDELCQALIGQSEMAWFSTDLLRSGYASMLALAVGFQSKNRAAIAASHGTTTIFNSVIWHPPGSAIFRYFAKRSLAPVSESVLAASGHLWISISDCFLGNWSEAEVRLAPVITWLENEHATRWYCEALSLYAKCAAFTGRTNTAAERFKKLLVYAEANGHGLGAIWAAQGLAEMILRDPDAETDEVLQSLDKIRHLVPKSQLNDPAYLIRLIGLRAKVLSRRGEIEAAYQEAVTGAYAIADVRYCGFWVHEGFGFIIDVLIEQYREERASGLAASESKRLINITLKKMRSHYRRFPPGKARYLFCKAEMNYTENNRAETLSLLNKSLGIAERYNLRFEVQRTLTKIALIQ